MSTASNLAVSIVAGVAVMFIWQTIQKAQAKKSQNRDDSMDIDHGGVQGGAVWSISDLYAPDWAKSKPTMQAGVYDILDNTSYKNPSRKTYYM